MKYNKLKLIFMCSLILVYLIGCGSIKDKNIEYKIKPNVIYYVLEDEYLENNDIQNPDTSELVRIFTCYDGEENSIYPDTEKIAFKKIDSIQEFRRVFLLEYPNGLRLPPNTIVGINVLNKWKSQDYDGSSSYSNESPSGLTYSKI